MPYVLGKGNVGPQNSSNGGKFVLGQRRKQEEQQAIEEAQEVGSRVRFGSSPASIPQPLPRMSGALEMDDTLGQPDTYTVNKLRRDAQDLDKSRYPIGGFLKDTLLDAPANAIDYTRYKLFPSVGGLQDTVAKYSMPDADYIGTDTNVRRNFMDQNALTQNVGGVTDFIGQGISQFMPGQGVNAGSIDDLAGRIGTVAGSKFSRPFASKLAEYGARGAVDEGLLAFQNDLAADSSKWGNALTEGAIGAGLGGGLGGIVGGGVFGAQAINRGLNRRVNGIELPNMKAFDSSGEDVVRKNSNIDKALRQSDELNTEIGDLNRQLSELDSDYERMVNEQYDFLKRSRDERGGVEQGTILRDEEGNVIDRVGRISNNPAWYQDFYSQYGRVPSNKDLKRLAKDHVEQGFWDESGFIPGVGVENRATRNTLNNVREDMSNTRRGIEKEHGDYRDTAKTVEPVQPPIVQTPSPINKQPVQDTQKPTTNVRGFYQQAANSGKESAATLERVDDLTYTPKPNEELVNNSNGNVKDINKTYSDVMRGEAKGKDKNLLTDQQVSDGIRLLDDLYKMGDHERAADIVQRLAENGTEAGRSVQAYSLYSRLSPDGLLLYAQRKLKNGEKLSAEMQVGLREAANKLQSSKGSSEIAQDALDMLDSNKTDVGTLQNLKQATEKQTNKELNPRVRKRDNLAAYSKNQADAARERRKKRRNLGFAANNQGNEFVDLLIIGADHLIQKGVKYSDFSKAMQPELNGEDMNEVYVKSYDRYRRMKKLKQTDYETIINKALKGVELSDAEKFRIRKDAIELSQMSAKMQKEAIRDIQLQFNTIQDSSAGDKASAVLRISQLTNARTMIRNVLGNEFLAFTDFLRKKFIAAPLDAMSSFGKGQRTVFFRGNPENTLRNYWADWKEGLKAGWQGYNPDGLETQFDLRGHAFNPTGKKGLRKWGETTGSFFEKALGASLKSFDYAAANRAFKAELWDLAMARAHAEGKRGKTLRETAEKYFYANDEALTEQAYDYAKYMTFQDDTVLSKSLTKLKGDVLNAGKDFGLGNILLNYPKTTANILMRAVDYSPIGFIRTIGQLSSIAFKMQNKANKKEVINSLSRAIMGTGLFTTGAFLYDLGLLNVLPSKDSKINEFERMAGRIGNSVNLSGLVRYVMNGFDREAAKPKEGDEFHTIDWFQPLGMSASAGAAFNQAGDRNKLQGGNKISNQTVDAVAAAADSLINMSVLKNVKSLFGDTTYGAKTQDKVVGFMADFVGAFIPGSLIGQTRNAVDPTVRETKDDSSIQQGLNRLTNRIPGLSNKLPAQVDQLGHEKKSDFGTVRRIINAFVMPSNVDVYNPSKEVNSLANLLERTGDKSVIPSKPDKDITISGKPYHLTPKEYENYLKVRGLEIEKGLKKELNNLDGNRLKDKDKIKRVQDIIRKGNELASKAYQKEKGIK